MAFQQYDGPIMGISFLEFRYTKQFFRRTAFFCGQKWHFVGFKCFDFSFQHIISLTRKGYFAGKGWLKKRNSRCAPRCMKMRGHHLEYAIWRFRWEEPSFKGVFSDSFSPVLQGFRKVLAGSSVPEAGSNS
ncbi:hypothetical protein [Chryseobacterium koreense]